MQIGLIERTPRGRRVTSKAYKHLGRYKNKRLSIFSVIILDDGC